VLPKLLVGVCGKWLVKRVGPTPPPYQISYFCSFSEVWIFFVSLSVSTLKKTYLSFWVVRDCALGIARRSGDLIPRFSAPVQTGPGTHPTSCTSGTVSFPGVKRPVRGVEHPPQLSTKVKESIGLYLYFLPRLSWPVLKWTVSLHFT
jgi:hypothetical protein